MNKKNVRYLPKTQFLYIIIAFLISYTAVFAQNPNPTNTESMSQKTFTIENTDPNIAAKVVREIIKLEILQLPQGTVIVPNREKSLITVRAENPRQMKLIEELIKTIDFQIQTEGTISRKSIQVNNLIFDYLQKIIGPLLTKGGYLSYNISTHTLSVKDIAENLNHIENFINKIDSNEFWDMYLIPDENDIYPVDSVDPNEDISILPPEQTDTNSVEVTAAVDINEPLVTVKFSGFRIEQIIERLKQWTGKEIIVPQEAMNLRISVYTPEKIKLSEAIDLIYKAIRQTGYIAEENEDEIIFTDQPFQPDTEQIIEPSEPLENITNKDMLVHKTYKLEYEKPSTIGQLISEYLSSSGYYIADDNTNTLLLGDTVQYLMRIESMIKVYDANPDSGIIISPVKPIDPNEQAMIQNPIPPPKVNDNSVFSIPPALLVFAKNFNTYQTSPNVTKNKSKIRTYLDRIIKKLDSITIKSDDPRVDVNLTNADINQIIDKLIRWTGKAVLPSNESLNLKINLSPPKKIRQSKALKLLYKEIEDQGFIIDNRNNIIYIKPDPNENKIKLTPSSQDIKNENILDASDSNNYDPMVAVSIFGLNIDEIVQILQAWTGKKVIPSQEAKDLKITAFSPERIKQSEALSLLYYAIRNQGFIVENRNDILYITIACADPGLPVIILGPDDSLDDIKDNETIVRRQFKLKNLDPTETGEILLPLLSPSGQMIAEKMTNTLTITDTVKNLKQCEEIIEKLDSHPPGNPFRIFEVSITDANEIVRRINSVINDPNFNRTGRTAEKTSDINSVEIQVFDNNETPLVTPDHRDWKITLTKEDAEKYKKEMEDFIRYYDKINEQQSEEEKDKRQEYESVYVGFINADIAALKLNDMLTKIGIDVSNNLIILPLATSKQVLVFGNNEKERKLAANLIHDLDFQAAEDSYDFEYISLNYIEPQAFTNFVTDTIGVFKNLRLSLYPIPDSNQILVFGGKEYRDVIREYSKNIDKPLENIESETLSLKYIDSAKAAKILNEIFANTDTNDKNIILIEERNNQLLLIANKDVKQTIKNILKEIDTQLFVNAQEYNIIPIRSFDVIEIYGILYAIFNKSNVDYKNKITIVPVSEFKTLLVYGDSNYCKEIRQLTAEPPESPQLSRKAFKLKYVNSLDIQKKLEKLFDHTNTDSPDSQTFPEDTVISTIFPSLNELVVLASQENITKIADLIDQWDQIQENHKDSNSPVDESNKINSGI